MEDLKELITSRAKHPFWSALTLSYLTLNWKLIVLSIYEFETISLEIFKENLVGFNDDWKYVPFLIALTNAIAGQSIKEFINAISTFIFNNTRSFYIRLIDKNQLPKKCTYKN